ncbi:MAG: hypothetical protein EX272_11520 [Chromatiales bacterium]|nr:MAG: hypothetical protein EX272_11520 [Chromatiales bacterium]
MNHAAAYARLPQTLIESFTGYVERDELVALLTVVSTDGSTYSKAGGQILIGADGQCHGLLSGGCLEQDLTERAAAVMRSGAAETVEYDLRSDDDVFGLGVGCEGLLRIHIQPLGPATAYAPLSTWLEESEKNGVARAEFALADGSSTIHLNLLGPREILVLGAGQDAVPLVSFCRELGWRVTVSDHRPAHVAELRDQHDCAVLCTAVDTLGDQVELDRFDAVIVMSHHLASDREYLRQLAGTSVGFVGLLGPPHRSVRLLSEIGAGADRLAGRLRSPVGRRIGGRGPAAIALEIVAELQEYFSAANPD